MNMLHQVNKREEHKKKKVLKKKGSKTLKKIRKMIVSIGSMGKATE
jgi:hypothetical protein